MQPLVRPMPIQTFPNAQFYVCASSFSAWRQIQSEHRFVIINHNPLKLQLIKIKCVEWQTGDGAQYAGAAQYCWKKTMYKWIWMMVEGATRSWPEPKWIHLLMTYNWFCFKCHWFNQICQIIMAATIITSSIRRPASHHPNIYLLYHKYIYRSPSFNKFSLRKTERKKFRTKTRAIIQVLTSWKLSSLFFGWTSVVCAKSGTRTASHISNPVRKNAKVNVSLISSSNGL